MKKINFVYAVFLFFTLLFTNGTLHALSNDITVRVSPGRVSASSGMDAAFVMEIAIPEDSYIYANPKGKGIGRASEISLQGNAFLSSWEARYPAGEEYLAPGDSDTVFVYRRNVRIPVRFHIGENLREGSYRMNVEVSLLQCRSGACIPFEKKLIIPVRIEEPGVNLQGKSADAMKEFLSLQDNESRDGNTGSGVRGTELSSGSIIPEDIVFEPRYPEGRVAGLLQAVLLGLIAGFILNFMPCVLPVVSLKIMSFVMNAGEKRRVIAFQGLLFTAGILVSFLILATLAAFFGYKWGALFQNRFFIIAMTSFIFAMALSLFGVFTLSVPVFTGKLMTGSRGIYADAFLKGVLATLLATPCSGPFLGGTLAWTLSMPAGTIFLIFISIGTGMALPYLIISLNPALVRYIPKPGAWTGRFETAMGFLLMLTVVYLVSVLNEPGRMGLLLFLLIFSAGLWQYGIYGSVINEKWKRITSLVILIMITAAGYFLSFGYIFSDRQYPHERIVFSAERLLENSRKNVISVVVFTADWCPNCRLAEKLALEDREVRKLLALDEVEFIVADITEKNPPAESLMNRLGSRSIPFLAIFPPGDGFRSPICLRDIYSSEDLVRGIAETWKFMK